MESLINVQETAAILVVLMALIALATPRKYDIGAVYFILMMSAFTVGLIAIFRVWG